MKVRLLPEELQAILPHLEHLATTLPAEGVGHGRRAATYLAEAVRHHLTLAGVTNLPQSPFHVTRYPSHPKEDT